MSSIDALTQRIHKEIAARPDYPANTGQKKKKRSPKSYYCYRMNRVESAPVVGSLPILVNVHSRSNRIDEHTSHFQRSGLNSRNGSVASRESKVSGTASVSRMYLEDKKRMPSPAVQGSSASKHKTSPSFKWSQPLSPVEIAQFDQTEIVAKLAPPLSKAELQIVVIQQLRNEKLKKERCDDVPQNINHGTHSQNGVHKDRFFDIPCINRRIPAAFERTKPFSMNFVDGR